MDRKLWIGFTCSQCVLDASDAKIVDDNASSLLWLFEDDLTQVHVANLRA